MFQMATRFLIVVWLFPLSNAFFFGLLNSRETAKPDLVINKVNATKSDRKAYEQYPPVIERQYPLYTQVHYVPVHIYRPLFSEYTQSYSMEPVYDQPDSIYQYVIFPKPQPKHASVRAEYSQDKSGFSTQQPIVVQPLENVTDISPDINTMSSKLTSASETFDHSQHQIPAYNNEVPISNITSIFPTGGYATDPL